MDNSTNGIVGVLCHHCTLWVSWTDVRCTSLKLRKEEEDDDDDDDDDDKQTHLCRREREEGKRCGHSIALDTHHVSSLSLVDIRFQVN